MNSRNFEILRPAWPELAALGGFAESYAHSDPASALVKLRLLAENFTKDIYRDLSLPKPEQATFVDLLMNQSFAAITPKVILDKLHALRIHGNKAAHGEPATSKNAIWLVQEAFDLSRWLFVQFGKGDAKAIPAFRQPSVDGSDDTKGQLKREKRQSWSASRLRKRKWKCSCETWRTHERRPRLPKSVLKKSRPWHHPVLQPRICCSLTRPQRGRELSTAFSR